MAYTVAQLITQAWYTSNIVSRDLEVPSSSEMSDGFRFLNMVLRGKSRNSNYVPYYQEYSLVGVVGQEGYFIENLLEIQTITFFKDSVRYQMSQVNRVPYFGTPRAENINSLPYSWHSERELNGTRIYLYFRPDQTYPIKIWGKFGLEKVVAYEEDLSEVYEDFYIEYLEYELANYMCIRTGVTTPDGVKLYLDQISEEVNKLSPPDFTQQKLTTLGQQTSLNYANINFPGWTQA